jgi:uncharacterized HAD superfamily protein
MDTQNLLYNASQMPLTELEAFVHQLNAVITRKRRTDKNLQDTLLLDKINRTVLAISKRERYQTLIYKLEMETISETEHAELLELVEQEEKIRVKRIKYLIELAQLRNVTVPQLMKTLELTKPTPTHV